MSNPTTPFGWQMPTNTDLVTDLPADFEVFGQAVATSMADLLGGTTGQILAKNSNTDMDFVWIANDQGDITGVTATSPLTGGGTSGAITVGIQAASTTQSGAVQLTDSTSSTSTTTAATPNSVKTAFDTATTANTTANAAIPKSTVTTAGDVIYATGSSAVTRLGIGTTGQVLTVSGGAPSWATPTSSGGMTLLSTTSLSGASTTISSISGSYNQLCVVLRSVKPATDAVDVLLRFNSDSGSNYDTSAWDGSGNFVAASSITLMGNVDNATTTTGMTLQIPDYADTTSYKYCYFIGSGVRGAGTAARFQMTGHWTNTSAISSITLLPSSGNWTSGSVLIYGVK